MLTPIHFSATASSDNVCIVIYFPALRMLHATVDNRQYTFKHTENFCFVSISVKSYIAQFRSSLIFQTTLVDSDVNVLLIFW